MNYLPETRWVGGKYPGVKPPHLHHCSVRVVERKVKTYYQPRPAKNAILAVVRTQGPISIANTALAVGKSENLVNIHLLDMQREGLITKEYRRNKNNKHSQMYYSAVQ